MRSRVAFAALLVMTSVSVVSAGPYGLVNRRTYGTNNAQQTNRPFLGTAQHAANYMASLCRIGHFGGNSGYEGVGCGVTPHQAEMNCCFRHKWAPREVGIAQGANGMFYACCRY